MVTSLNVPNAYTMASHTTSEAPNTVTLLVDIAEFMIADPPPHIMFPRPQRQVLVQSSSSWLEWMVLYLSSLYSY